MEGAPRGCFSSLPEFGSDLLFGPFLASSPLMLEKCFHLNWETRKGEGRERK